LEILLIFAALKKNYMYAIVDIAGQQFKVEKDQKVFVHRLENEVGTKVEFDNVMLVDNDGNVKVGAPVVAGAKVSATVISHLKGEKVIVFKKKRIIRWHTKKEQVVRRTVANRIVKD
jgi:large subunit ribosomal protein L21